MEQQIDFESMDRKLDDLQSFMLGLLKEKNPQAYLKFNAEINREEK